MSRYMIVSSLPPVPNSQSKMMWSDSSALPLAVWNRGPQGFTRSDRLLGWCAQLSSESLEISTGSLPGPGLVTQPCVVTVLCANVGLQARNFMRQMKEGQLAFFYHSNCKEPGIAGVMKVGSQSYKTVERLSVETWHGECFLFLLNMSDPSAFLNLQTVFCLETVTLSLAHLPHLLLQIVKEAYVDHTQFDKKDVHFDASSKPDNPKWSMVN